MTSRPHPTTPAGEDNWWANNGGAPWKGNRAPSASVNFVTAHDGFTLADLVAYNEKHNEVGAGAQGLDRSCMILLGCLFRGCLHGHL